MIASSSLAQQVLSERVTVNAVELPVYVTRNGLPVRSLTKEDFELYVNGVAHPIDYVDLVTEPAPSSLPSAAQALPRDLSRRRLVVLLFDTMNSSTISIYRAREAARKYLVEAPAGDTFAVATVGSHGVSFSAAFTNDRVAIQRALSTLRPSIAGDVFNLATSRGERTSMQSSMEMNFSPSTAHWNSGVGLPVYFGSRSSALAAALDRKYKEIEAIGRTLLEERFVGQLGRLAERLAPLQGIKHVVLLSQSAIPAEEREPYGLISRMHERFRAAGVMLDAIDLRGLEAPTRTTRWKDPDPASILYTYALDTGGMVIANAGVEHALRVLRDMQSVAYVVGFTPPANQKASNSVRISVRNQRLFTSVQYRRTYSSTSAEADGDGLFLADVMSNDIPQGGMNVNVTASPEAGGVTVAASVPGVEVLTHAAAGKTLLDVFIYVFDEQKVVAGWGHARLLVDTEMGQEFLSSNAYSVRQQFALPPGRYVAKALVRVVGGRDVTGFQRADFVTGAP